MMNAKGKSPSRAETSCVIVESDDSAGSDTGSRAVPNSRKRAPPPPITSQVHPSIAAKMRDIKGKGKHAAKKMKTDTTADSGVLVPSMALDFPDSDEKMMDQPILIGLDSGECGGTILIYYYVL